MSHRYGRNQASPGKPRRVSAKKPDWKNIPKLCKVYYGYGDKFPDKRNN